MDRQTDQDQPTTHAAPQAPVPPATDSLHQRLRAFEAVFSAITDFAYLFDRGGRVVLANKPLLDRWGLTLERAVGRTFLELNYPEPLAAELHRQVLVVIDKRERVVHETRHADGCHEYVFAPVLAADGTVEAVAGTARDVTGRRRDDERGRTILESITDGFFALDRDWRFIYANPQAEQLLGRRPDDLIGRVLWDEYPGLHGSEFERAYRRVAVERVAASVTAHYPDHDRWYEVHAYPSQDGGISVYFRDVSERRRADDALRQGSERLRTSEERLAFAVHAAELGTFYCPMPPREIVWNAKCKEHFWLPPDAAVDFERFYSIIHPDDRDRTRAAVDRAVIDGEPYDVHYRTVAPDGRVRWVRAKGRAYYDAAGQPTRFDGVTMDVTEQKRAEDALRASELRLTDTIRTALDCVIGMDHRGAVTEWNPAAERAFGYARAEALGREMAELIIPPALRERHRAGLRRYLAERTGTILNRRLELTAVRRDGGEFPVELTISAVAMAEPPEFTAFVRDVTDRKLAEAERQSLLDAERAARAEAERASRMKDEFLATLSHELRTPLNAILGWSQVMRRSGGGKGGDPDDLAQGLEVIERNARVQAQIIEDLLDMSRIVSGNVRLDVQRVDLAAIVRAAVDTARPTADAKGVRLHAVIDPLHGVTVAGDANRLQQVMWNLLSNAVKFTPRGGRVQALVERVNSHLEVSVIDTGEGIAPEFLPFVFDRFRQADASTTRRHGGLGLGLSIVKQLVELHGGNVRAKSPGLGAGATFIVALPLTVVHPAPDADDGTTRDHPTVRPVVPDFGDGGGRPCVTLDGVRVLMVDDEPDARALVKRLLEDCGADVTTTGSGEEAVALVGSGGFDVLVSDIGMPVVDGYTVIRRVRALGKDRGGGIPAVALTAYARSEDRVKAIAAGYLMHVAKPVEPTELVTVVAAAAGRISA